MRSDFRDLPTLPQLVIMAILSEGTGTKRKMVVGEVRDAFVKVMRYEQTHNAMAGVLRTMEERGFIESIRVQVKQQSGPERLAYYLTPEGRSSLRRWRKVVTLKAA